MGEFKQTALSDFYEGHKKVIKGGHKEVITSTSAIEYINKNLIQQPLVSPKPYHKGHRYLFIFNYNGAQPIHGYDALSYFGKARNVPQARFNYSEEKAILFSLPHTLKIWIKHPIGARTKEELVEARKTAWRVAESFSRKHGIAIMSEKSAGFSEHTIEHKPLDGVIRPIVITEPELAKERLELSINQTSHKNKVEWTGKAAKERVMALEKLLDTDVLGKIETIEQGVGALSEGQARIIRRLARKPRQRGGDFPVKPISKEDRGMFG